MKKIAFVLAVLLFATPALALVTIDANQVPGTAQVEISYVTDGNLPRAFGLNITVDAGVITACVPAFVGECNDVLQGYGIFPGTIQIDVGGNVTDDGTPYAPVGATGALGGIDSNGVTLEMGSLYVGLNEPAASGLLCTITVTADCNVTIEGNAARCGTGSAAKGVVMEDPDEVPEVDYIPGPPIIIGCMPTGHDDYAEWASPAVGKPESWCIPRQCRGDADGLQETVGKLQYWVGYNDLNIFIAAWMDKVLDFSADFSHSSEVVGKLTYRVGYDDLDIFIDNWMDKLGSLPDCLDVP